MRAHAFESDEFLDNVIRDTRYSRKQFICFGISFLDNGPDYKYKLRFNIYQEISLSDGPYTQGSFTTPNAFDKLSYYKTYLSKMAITTHLVNSVIAEA